MARTLKVYVPDVAAPVINAPDSGMTGEEARDVVVGVGFTAMETAEFVETIASDNGREIRFKRPIGGTKS